LRDFLKSNLRRAIFQEPKHEREIQNAIETLLLGRGLTKGIDYDRETGRVKLSIKESVPDFIFPKLDLALEVKFTSDITKSKRIVDETNADIRTYSTKYSRLLFVIYDLGSIRDESEFKLGIENPEKIDVAIIKH
jgi:REase_DpnII-MboI